MKNEDALKKFCDVVMLMVCCRLRCGFMSIKKCDFVALDERLLPDVVKICRDIYYGVKESCPRKVEVHAVQSLLGLPEKQLYSLPNCLAAIREYRCRN